MSEFFSSLRVAAASAAERAHDALLLKYEPATASVKVTSQVAQRSSYCIIIIIIIIIIILNALS